MQDHMRHQLCLMILSYDIDYRLLELVVCTDSEPIN
jgi:hypothetical protein